MSAANEKRELLTHVEKDHPNLESIKMSMSLNDLRQMHDVSHWSEHHDHTHDVEEAVSQDKSETVTPDMSDDSSPKAFQDFVNAEVQRKMVETQKRYEAGWQRIVGNLQNTGTAKAELDRARKFSSDVMQAAADFRKAEAELSQAVASMIELIAKEHG